MNRLVAAGVLSLALCAAPGGCSLPETPDGTGRDGAPGTPDATRPGADAGPSIAPGALLDGLRRDPTTRAPTLAPPSTSERECLEAYDARHREIYASVPRQPELTEEVRNALRRAGVPIDGLEIEVLTDFGLADNGGVGGGHAGHEVFYIDGKLLDVARDYAAYATAVAAGETTLDEIEAIDSIVAYHMRPEAAGLHAPPLMDPPAGREGDAQERYEAILGAITYHEYAHIYLYHALYARCRPAVTGVPSVMLLMPTIFEDDADFVSGVLTAKAERDGEIATRMYDLMSFYGGYRLGLLTSFADVTDVVYQFGMMSPAYSALAKRKENFLAGVHYREGSDERLPGQTPRVVLEEGFDRGSLDEWEVCGDIYGDGLRFAPLVDSSVGEPPPSLLFSTSSDFDDERDVGEARSHATFDVSSGLALEWDAFLTTTSGWGWPVFEEGGGGIARQDECTGYGGLEAGIRVNYLDSAIELIARGATVHVIPTEVSMGELVRFRVEVSPTGSITYWVNGEAVGSAQTSVVPGDRRPVVFQGADHSPGQPWAVDNVRVVAPAGALYER